MNVVVEYLNIDINYLKSITTRKEQLNENNKWNEKKFYKKRFHSG